MKSERISIVPFEMKYLNDYVGSFDADITQYQWPDPFESIEDARAVLQSFLNEMEREETLLFAILSKQGEFLGSVEIHGLASDCPELGVWIIASAQRKGYAYEALTAVLDDVRSRYGKAEFYYEADVRNTGSIRLLRKLEGTYGMVEHGVEKVVTDTGKYLELQGFTLQAKSNSDDGAEPYGK